MPAIKNIDRTRNEVIAFLKRVEKANTEEIYNHIKSITIDAQSRPNASGSFNSYSVTKNRLGAVLRRWCINVGMKNKNVLWKLKEEYK